MVWPRPACRCFLFAAPSQSENDSAESSAPLLTPRLIRNRQPDSVHVREIVLVMPGYHAKARSVYRGPRSLLLRSILAPHRSYREHPRPRLMGSNDSESRIPRCGWCGPDEKNQPPLIPTAMIIGHGSGGRKATHRAGESMAERLFTWKLDAFEMGHGRLEPVPRLRRNGGDEASFGQHRQQRGDWPKHP